MKKKYFTKKEKQEAKNAEYRRWYAKKKKDEQFREKEKKRKQQYREQNKEQLKIKWKEYYAKNKEKRCQLEKDWRAKNADWVKERERLRYQKRRVKYLSEARITRIYNKLYTWKLKSIIGCVICGEKNPIILDWHHINPSEKEFNISRLTSRCRLLKNILPELFKCTVLCCKCHRIQHENNNIRSEEYDDIISKMSLNEIDLYEKLDKDLTCQLKNWLTINIYKEDYCI